MASVMLQQLYISAREISGPSALLTVIRRNSSSKSNFRPKRGTIKHRNLIQSDCQSLADRGFLRSQKPYNPPDDAPEKVKKIVENFLGSEFQFSNPIPKNMKFPILEECWKVFEYSIPNSQLHNINDINDLIHFYKTPIKTTNPYDDLKNTALPPNLHILYDYIRFDPETDVKFKGVTAFPRSPKIITSLKNRLKYKDVKQKLPDYYYNDTDNYTIK